MFTATKKYADSPRITRYTFPLTNNTDERGVSVPGEKQEAAAAFFQTVPAPDFVRRQGEITTMDACRTYTVIFQVAAEVPGFIRLDVTDSETPAGK